MPRPRDKSLQDSYSLSEPEVLALEIAADLQAAIELFAGIAADLRGETHRRLLQFEIVKSFIVARKANNQVMAKKKERHPERGPLPIDDRNSELQSHSISALRNMLPPEKFIVRREDAPDTGVDITIELKDRVGAIPFATGDKSNVQLKCCERPSGKQHAGASKCEELNDGSISYPIATSNLNQLLNHHCPLYILYIKSSKSLYFAWASGGGSQDRKRGDRLASAGVGEYPLQESTVEE